MNKSLMLIGLVAGSLLVSAVGANADVHVRGHFRSNGTYVAPHYRSNPDGSSYNNWSYSGNYNPYTGAQGYRTSYGSADLLSRPDCSRSTNLLAPSWTSSKLY